MKDWQRLLEAEEFDDAEIDRRVEADAALVGPERRVELHAEAAVDLHLAVVVDPRHAEDDLPLRLADALDERVFRIVRMFRHDPPETFQHLPHRLVEFRLSGIAAQHFVEDGFKLFVDLGQRRSPVLLSMGSRGGRGGCSHRFSAPS
jgi:hypothetical protein